MDNRQQIYGVLCSTLHALCYSNEMKYYFISLGCAKNLVDSEKISKILSRYGYGITGIIQEANLVLINTCGFIKKAKQESIDTVLSVLQEKPKNAKVIVFGCLVQRYKKELETLIPEVDLFLPALPYKEIAKNIQKKFSPLKLPCTNASLKKICFTPPSYTYIKIADGCNNRCSYCTIPLIRGPLKSIPIDQILKDIKKALNNNVYEINLIAQDLTSYGRDLYGKPSLDMLLESILSIKKEFWLRLLYLYPSGITPRIVNLIKSDQRITKYLDIPVQHVNDRILKLMNRRYSKKLLLEKFAMLREEIPDIVIRSTFIVGFPTESEEEFEELADFVRQIKFDHLGVFEYSEEEDTVAFNIKGRIPYSMKRKRKKALMQMQQEIVKNKNEAIIGKEFPCLIEMPVDEYGAVWSGRIYSQAPEVDGSVFVTDYQKKIGNVVDVLIKNFKYYDLIAECKDAP